MGFSMNSERAPRKLGGGVRNERDERRVHSRYQPSDDRSLNALIHSRIFFTFTMNPNGGRIANTFRPGRCYLGTTEPLTAMEDRPRHLDVRKVSWRLRHPLTARSIGPIPRSMTPPNPGLCHPRGRRRTVNVLAAASGWLQFEGRQYPVVHGILPRPFLRRPEFQHLLLMLQQ